MAGKTPTATPPPCHPATALGLCPSSKWRRPSAPGPLYPRGPPRSSRWAALPPPTPEGVAAPAQRRLRLHFRLSAAASGPPFLGNNGAENGRLRGEGRRRGGCLGTDGAGRARTEPAEERGEQRTESWGGGGGQRRRAVSIEAGGGLSKWPGEGRGPGPGEAAAAAAPARSRGRPGAPLSPLWASAVRAAASRVGQGGSWLRGAREAETAPRQRRSGVP